VETLAESGADRRVRAGGRGRDQEYAQFVRLWYRSLIHTAWLLTGDGHVAEELVQSVLVKAYVIWPRLRQQEPLAYVRRMLVNARTDRWRKTRREQLTEDLPARGADDPALRTVDDRDTLIRALQTLTPRERQIIVLRYFHDLTQEEVAADLDLSVGTVKSTASRALAQLRVHEPLRAFDTREGAADAQRR
jgi:RNA polymerase sigma-70 factor (sigma-E family)